MITESPNDNQLNNSLPSPEELGTDHLISGGGGGMEEVEKKLHVRTTRKKVVCTAKGCKENDWKTEKKIAED